MERNAKDTPLTGNPAATGSAATKELAPTVPTIGRTVNYYLQSENKTPVAAIITDVHNKNDGIVDLMLLGARVGASGIRLETSVPFATTPLPGHWSWPARI